MVSEGPKWNRTGQVIPQLREYAAQNKPGKQHYGKRGKELQRRRTEGQFSIPTLGGEAAWLPGCVIPSGEFRDKPFMWPDLQGGRFSPTPSLHRGPHQHLPRKAWRKPQHSTTIWNHSQVITKAEPLFPAQQAVTCLKQLSPGRAQKPAHFHFHAEPLDWKDPPRSKGTGVIYYCSINLGFSFNGEQNKCNLALPGKLEVVIYGIKDLFQTTLLLCLPADY